MAKKSTREVIVKNGAYPAPPLPPKASRGSSTPPKPRDSKPRSS